MNKFIAFEKSIGGVVFRVIDGKILYLLLQYRSWQWDFPKGHQERGESEEQTLRRELLEETGISQISILPGFHRSVYYFYSARGREKMKRIDAKKGINIFKKVVYYAVKTDVSEVRIDFENKNFAWLAFDEAYERIGNKDSKRILDLANRFILDGKIN